MAKISFIGMGVMGAPMAGHLSYAGHDVTVFNRTSKKAINWCEKFDGRRAETPAEAAKNAEFVLTCVGNDDDLRDVLIGEQGALKTMSMGTTLIDHTTVSSKVTQEIYDLTKQKQIQFVDAPISGGQAGAEKGALSIMCGGDEEAYICAEPIMLTYARICRRIGGSGAGQKTKMCNQIAIAGLLQGLSEALHFSENSGLDSKKVVEVISQGAAGSWQMVNRYETMLSDKFDHGFAVDWMRKDLDICLKAAEENQTSLPITALVDQFYKEVQKMGGGRWDTSSLFKRLKENG